MLDLSGLDGPTKFETILAFKRCKVDLLEAKLKQISGENKHFTLEQLREGFATDKIWHDLTNDDSLLVKVITSEYFEDEENKGSISRDAMILYAVLASNGDAATKARVLYDVLQDNNQEFISANDKDFSVSISKIVDLATKLIYANLHLVDESASPKVDPSNFSQIDDKKEELSEGILDEVFGAASKLTRKEWEGKVAKSQKWLFNTKEARTKVEKLLGL